MNVASRVRPTRFARERIMENAFSMYRQREALFGDPRCLMQTRAARSLVRAGLNGNFYIKVGKSVTGIVRDCKFAVKKV